MASLGQNKFKFMSDQSLYKISKWLKFKPKKFKKTLVKNDLFSITILQPKLWAKRKCFKGESYAGSHSNKFFNLKPHQDLSLKYCHLECLVRNKNKQLLQINSLAQTTQFPLLMHWNYCSFMLNHLKNIPTKYFIHQMTPNINFAASNFSFEIRDQKILM